MNFLLVFIGGGIGSCLRYTFSLFISVKPNSFPWATLSANLISCFIVGLLIGQISKGDISQHQKLLLITGFCGGFSTFSTFGSEVIELIKSGFTIMAVGYVLLSVIVGSFLVIGGSVIANN